MEPTTNNVPLWTLHIRQFQMMTLEAYTVQMATWHTCAIRYKTSFSDAPWEKMSMSPVSIIEART